ncbi:hypothetical protein EYF80_048415 [Liparis tanakae]|uniref:Uncharacterized protein n=1 Tax=Liparis tanakae TaxID=230148 RepID=A0A4Z2FKY7_9TELE|nr:hypothetical protein EYF80_048415 [Liparis tanakae]
MEDDEGDDTHVDTRGQHKKKKKKKKKKRKRKKRSAYFSLSFLEPELRLFPTFFKQPMASRLLPLPTSDFTIGRVCTKAQMSAGDQKVGAELGS